MLVIRHTQLDSFRQDAIDRFQDDMIQAIATEMPAKFELLGEAGIRALIGRAIVDGSERGIRNQGAVAVLIELKVQFGEDFEMSPERAWANKILAHPALPDYIRVDLARQRMASGLRGRTLVPVAATMPPTDK